MSPTADGTIPTSSRTVGGRLGFVVFGLFWCLLPAIVDRAAHEPYTVAKAGLSAAVLAACAGALLLARSSGSVSLPGTAPILAATAALAVVSASMATSPGAAWEELRPLFLIGGGAYLAGALTAAGDRRKALLCEGLAFVGAFAAAVGCAQAAQAVVAAGAAPSWSEDPWAAWALALGAFDPRSWDVSEWGRIGVPIRRLLDLLPARPFAGLPAVEGPPPSLFGHANLAAGVVAAGVAATVVRFRADLRARGFALVVRIPVLLLRLGVMALSLRYLHLAAARGPVLALALVLGAAATVFVAGAPVGFKRRRALLLFAAACLVVVAGAASDRRTAVRGAGAPESLVDRMKSLVEPSGDGRDTVTERLVLWRNTGAMIREGADLAALTNAPLFGVGPGNWAVRYPEFGNRVMTHATGTFTLRRRPDHAHQDPLEFLAEHGLVGLMAAALFLAAAAAAVMRGIRSIVPARRDATFGLALPVLVLGLDSLASFPYRTAIPVLWTFGALGALQAIDPRDSTEATGPTDARRATTLWATLLYAGVAALGGSRLGAATALVCGAAVAFAATWMTDGVAARRATAMLGTAAAVALGATVVGRFGDSLERLVFAVGAVGSIAAALRRFDLPVMFGPGASRAAGVVLMLVAVAAAAAGRARTTSSNLFRTGAERMAAAEYDTANRPSHARVAADAFDASTARAPFDAAQEARRADAYAALGRFDTARASAERSAKLDPGLPNPLVLNANVAFAFGRYEEARRFAESAVRLRPGAPEARLVLARAYEAQRRNARALEEYERSIRVAPGGFAPFAKIAAARLRLRTNDDPARALVWLIQAEMESSRDPLLLEQVARLLGHSSLPSAAVEASHAAWRKLAALAPTRGRARMMVVSEPLRRPAPPSPEVASRIAQELKDLAARLPDDDQAEERLYRGAALEIAGRLDEAETAFRDAFLLATRFAYEGGDDQQVAELALVGVERLRGGAATRPASAPTSTGVAPRDDD